MVSSLNEIKKPIDTELHLFEEKFRASMKSSVPLLDYITRYIIKRKGKQMRPMFVFLSASLCGGVTEATHRAAILVELLHTATLVHDDVVDNSFKRRGFFSINALWKNKVAVLIGDFLLSKGLLLAIKNKDFDLLKAVSKAVEQMSEGELLQIERARRLVIDEKTYFDIIQKKTASLIAACCASGAISAGASESTVERMQLLGEKIGIAFQIKDDLFDFGTDDVGKPLGIDIKEKKMTLPLIYALNKASYLERRRIMNLVKNHNERPEKIAEVIEFVSLKDGLTYSEQKMKLYQQEALDILHQFPPHHSRTALEQLVYFTTERKK